MVRVRIDQNAVDKLIKELEKLPEALRLPVRKRILRIAAKPLIAAAQANVKDSGRTHYKYPEAKGRRRKPKGQGQKLATYHSGNLRKSIGIIEFGKSKEVFVGPRFGKRGRRYDGYYGAMVEYGAVHFRERPFMRPAYEQTKGQVIKLIEEGCRAAIKKHISENGLNR